MTSDPAPTCTRLCKRPELARSRLDLVDLRASGSASRPAGSDWSARVEATIEAREPGQPAEAMRLTLPGHVALSFGLDLLDGAAFCLEREEHPARPPGQAPALLPSEAELRLLALSARAATARSVEVERDLAWLRSLCAAHPEGAGRTWPLAERHEGELEPLRRAGLIETSGFGPQLRARPTQVGRALDRITEPRDEPAAVPRGLGPAWVLVGGELRLAEVLRHRRSPAEARGLVERVDAAVGGAEVEAVLVEWVQAPDPSLLADARRALGLGDAPPVRRAEEDADWRDLEASSLAEKGPPPRKPSQKERDERAACDSAVVRGAASPPSDD